MEKILARWKSVNERLKDLESQLDEGSAFWDNQEYAELFEERSRLNYLFQNCHDEVDREVVKRAFRAVIGHKDRRQSKSDWIFLTVNPKDGDYKNFVDSSNRFHNRAVVSNYNYCFEQRGEEEGDYHGFHLHSIFKRVGKPSHVERQIHEVFNRYVGDPELHIRIKYVSEEEIPKILEYIGGHKRDPEKQKKIDNDKLMRQEYGLKGLYTC